MSKKITHRYKKKETIKIQINRYILFLTVNLRQILLEVGIFLQITLYFVVCAKNINGNCISYFATFKLSSSDALQQAQSLSQLDGISSFDQILAFYQKVP